MNISTDILLCLTYLILWIVAFAWYHVKRFVLDSGTVIIGMQVIYAVFSILTLTDPLFSAAYEELALFAYDCHAANHNESYRLSEDDC